MKLGLTRKNKIECEDYIFPEDIFDIPGMNEYSDMNILRMYVAKRMKKWQGMQIELMINGGLKMEILEVIYWAYQYNISLKVFHRDNQSGGYVLQQVSWQPASLPEAFETIEASLITQRHVQQGKLKIFPEEIPAERVMDMKWLEKKADEFFEDYENLCLRLYISGLTTALIAVLNAASKRNTGIIAMHFDNDTEEYFEQVMGI